MRSHQSGKPSRTSAVHLVSEDDKPLPGVTDCQTLSQPGFTTLQDWNMQCMYLLRCDMRRGRSLSRAPWSSGWGFLCFLSRAADALLNVPYAICHVYSYSSS